MVIEDKSGSLWLIEKIPTPLYRRKHQIQELLLWLSHNGMRQVANYLPDQEGNRLISEEKTWWQISPYISGIPLDRPAYVMEEWRGPLMADFLLEFKSCNQALLSRGRSDVFSIMSYISSLMDTIRRFDPELIEPLDPIVTHLNATLAPYIDKLPIHLCHGDYHPLNIIWGEKDIRCVIDWEFFGFKQEAYDAANMVGCLGMEDPVALSGPLVRSFLGRLLAAGFMSDAGWRHFHSLLLAIRFGWLSEWLRKKDLEMIQLELTYMYLLMDNREQIEAGWI